MQDFKCFKKIISKNILFMMILVLLLVGVSEIIVNLMVANDSYVLDRNKSIFRILREPENSVDIIVLGDSLGMTSISPMAWWGDYGMTGYVCGQTGQRMQEAFHMLQAAYETQSPKLVILETNMVFRCKNLSSEIKDCLGEIGYPYYPKNNILLRIIRDLHFAARLFHTNRGNICRKMTRKKKFQKLSVSIWKK